MSRWLLALLFAFGTVSFLTGCPAADDTKDDTTTEAEGDKADGDKADGDKADGDKAEDDETPAE